MVVESKDDTINDRTSALRKAVHHSLLGIKLYVRCENEERKQTDTITQHKNYMIHH